MSTNVASRKVSQMSMRKSPVVAVLALLCAGCAHEQHAGAGRGGILDDLLARPGHPAMSSGAYAGASVHPAAAAASWGEPTIVPAGVSAAHADGDSRYLLDTGDRLRVFVYGQPNLSRLYTVDHDGKISVPLIGNITVRGMTTYGVESTLRQRLGREFVKDPQVTVDVQQNRPFFILGEVRNAGQYPYVSGMTIETAVAIAGGYSERANERKARITRRVNGFVEVIEVPPDYTVQPGDSVYVYERLL